MQGRYIVLYILLASISSIILSALVAYFTRMTALFTGAVLTIIMMFVALLKKSHKLVWPMVAIGFYYVGLAYSIVWRDPFLAILVLLPAVPLIALVALARKK